jgi:hypothetical protein
MKCLVLPHELRKMVHPILVFFVVIVHVQHHELAEGHTHIRLKEVADESKFVPQYQHRSESVSQCGDPNQHQGKKQNPERPISVQFLHSLKQKEQTSDRVLEKANAGGRTCLFEGLVQKTRGGY